MEYTKINGKIRQVYLYDDVKGEVKGVVQLVHGASENLSRYFEFSKYLNDNGFIVIGMDHLGHGTNNELKDRIFMGSSFSKKRLFKDQLELTDYIKSKYPQLEVSLYGYSMGSFVARNMIIDSKYVYKKVVLVGTSTKNSALLNLYRKILFIPSLLFSKVISKTLNYLVFARSILNL